MASKLFTLFGDDKLNRELNSQLSLSLKKKSESRNGSIRLLKQKSKALGRLKFLKLQLLHREFSGPITPVGRIMVASNRYARERFKKLRIRILEGQR